jgi:ADP-heptose:LPS heptosyltransferase
VRLITLTQNETVHFDTFRDRNIGQFNFTGGTEYVVPDFLAEFIETQSKNVASAVKWEAGNIYNGESLHGKRVLVMRGGGIGDVIFSTPFIVELKRLYPDSFLGLSVNSVYHTFMKLPAVDLLHDLLMTTEECAGYDYIINCENLIENNDEANSVDAYELHVGRFKVKPAEYKPVLSVNPKEDARIAKMVNTDRFNVVVQFSASVPIRSVAPSLWFKFLLRLKHDNMTVWIADGPKNGRNVQELVSNLSANSKILFRNFADITTDISSIISLIKRANLVIGLDSSYMHIAGAFGIPMIGLYGPFPSDLRIKYYKNAIGIDAESKCRFAKDSRGHCFTHTIGICSLAELTGKYYAPCLELITEEHIEQAYKLITLKTNRSIE